MSGGSGLSYCPVEDSGTLSGPSSTSEDQEERDKAAQNLFQRDQASVNGYACFLSFLTSLYQRQCIFVLEVLLSGMINSLVGITLEVNHDRNIKSR